MGFKDFFVFEGMMIISAIVLMWIYNISGLNKKLKICKEKHWSISLLIIFGAVILAAAGSSIVSLFKLLKYEYIIRGILLGFSISFIPYLMPENNKKKEKI